MKLHWNSWRGASVWPKRSFVERALIFIYSMHLIFLEGWLTYQFAIKSINGKSQMRHHPHTKFSVYFLFQRASFSSEASIKLEASSFNSGLSFGKYKPMWNCMSFLWKLLVVLWFPLNYKIYRNCMRQKWHWTVRIRMNVELNNSIFLTCTCSSHRLSEKCHIYTTKCIKQRHTLWRIFKTSAV